MLLQSHTLFELVVNPRFPRNDIVAMIDECHVISRRGQIFQEEYNSISHLRATIPSHVPFPTTPATFAPGDRKSFTQLLGMQPPTTFYVNLGSDQPDFEYRVVRMKDNMGLRHLDWVIGPENRGHNGVIKKTTTFVNKVSLTTLVLHPNQEKRKTTKIRRTGETGGIEEA